MPLHSLESEEYAAFLVRCASYGLSSHAVARLSSLYEQHGVSAATQAARIAHEEMKRVLLIFTQQAQQRESATPDPPQDSKEDAGKGTEQAEGSPR